MGLVQQENEVKVEVETPKVKQVKSYEGFRVWNIREDGVPEEVISGTMDEIDKLDQLDGKDRTKTYAIRIGKFGLK